MIPKSRYDTIDCYLASGEYNDREVLYDPAVYQQLLDGGLDKLLAQHIAHLFIRDPISLFAEKLEQDEELETDHFEVISVHLNMLSPSSLPLLAHALLLFRTLSLSLTLFHSLSLFHTLSQFFSASSHSLSQVSHLPSLTFSHSFSLFYTLLHYFPHSHSLPSFFVEYPVH